MKKEMVDGMNYASSTQTQKECEACVLGKMEKKHFPKQSQHRATRPYEIVHSDVPYTFVYSSLATSFSPIDCFHTSR